MSMYYSMVLVPADARLRPAPQQIVTFIESLLEMGAVGRPDTMFVRKHAPARVTSGRGEHRPPETTPMQSAKELPNRLRDLSDFDVDVAGTGPARVLPLRDLEGEGRLILGLPLGPRVRTPLAWLAAGVAWPALAFQIAALLGLEGGTAMSLAMFPPIGVMVVGIRPLVSGTAVRS